MMQEENHIFQGMRRGNHEIKQDSKFLWDAHNIRLTNRDDNTSFSITNERGTEEVFIDFDGHYVGHCVVGKYLIVFTATVNKPIYSHIYRVEIVDGQFRNEKLYEDKDILGLSPYNPIEALGSYENELIQKVYWIDGVHQPRVINVVADKLRDIVIDNENRNTLYPEGFDFVKELKLDETVSIQRIEGGTFSPGVIQYAFSYYNKYGTESNIFYTTELLNISYNDRGGDPEDLISNAFQITINGLECKKFQYVRIYSIHRTSIDSVPTVKIVEDIALNGNPSIIFVDNGRVGTIEDPNKLLYIGGEAILAKAFAAKDGTLFIGNYELVQKEIPQEIKDVLYNAVDKGLVSIGFRQVNLNNSSDSESSELSFYNYNNQLKCGNTSTFKVGDKYRLGLQFQYKTGKWSEPLWLGDKYIPREQQYRPSIENGILSIPIFSITLDFDTTSNLMGNGFRRVRPLVVLPTIYERMTLAQGVLCPTVFSVNSRKNNSPFAQASWFFRLMSTTDEWDLTKGSRIVHRHLDPLYYNYEQIALLPRGMEIQNMEKKLISEVNETLSSDDTKSINTMFVDQSILTFNSPDIEFDDSTRLGLDNKDMDLCIVGLSQFTSNSGDIDIRTSSPAPGANDTGFVHYTTFAQDDNGVNTCMASGVFYSSHKLVEENGKYNVEKDGNIVSYKNEYRWLVYPWNRTGSLINDNNRSEGNGSQTAVLERKVISNIKVSPDNYWLKKVYNPTSGITPVQIFDSNEVSLIKIPAPKNSILEGINYYGNVDSLSTSEEQYPLWYTYKRGVVNDVYPEGAPDPIMQVSFNRTGYGKPGEDSLSMFNTPVRIKYKSTPHAVFALNYNEETSLPTFLPSIGNLNRANEDNLDTKPFWLISANEKITKNTIRKIIAQEYRKTKSQEATSETEVYSTDNPVTIIKDQVIMGNWSGNFGNSFSEQDADNRKYLNEKFENGIKQSSGENVRDKWVLMTSAVEQTAQGENVEVNYADFYKFVGTEWVRCDDNEIKSTTMINYVTYDVVYKSEGGLYWRKKYRSNQGTAYTMEKTNEEDLDVFEQTQPVIVDTPKNASLFLAELVRKEESPGMFGGNSDSAIQSNLWIPANTPINLELIHIGEFNENTFIGPTVDFNYGDTYYQRYDCLKTYPFTKEDENSVVEIASFMCETRINIDGRYDRNRGQLSNLNMSPQNFNLINNVYSQKDDFFKYRVLDKDYYKLNNFENQITWSLEKQVGEDIDNWTHTTLANTLDMDGSKGSITALKTWGQNLLCFQEKALSNINFNSRVQIPTSDGTPIEISNGFKVDGSRILYNVGCTNKWSIADSNLGVYFLDSNTNNLYVFNGELENLSQNKGTRWWLQENNFNNSWVSIGSENNSIRTFYDTKYGDIYFTPGPTSLSDYSVSAPDSLCYSEQLGQFTSLMSYGGALAMFNFNDKFLSFKNIARNQGSLRLYINNVGKYNYFYDKYKEWNFSFISNNNPLVTKVFDTIEMRAEHYDIDNNLLYTCPTSFISASNEYQSGHTLTPLSKPKIWGKNMVNKFRIWRGIIPRHKGTMQRIRNPWAKITLGWTPKEESDTGNQYDEDNSKKAMIHDVTVKYTI